MPKIFNIVSGKTVGVLLVVQVILFYSSIFFNMDDLQIHYLDVGQGDSILIQTKSQKNMLIDCGPDEAVRAEVEGFLSPLITHIDIVIITHVDKDHYGGLSALLGRYRVKHLFVDQKYHSDPIVQEWIDTGRVEQVSSLVRNDLLNVDDIEFEVVWPMRNIEEEDNNRSTILKMRYGALSFLFTGDADAEILTNVLGSEDLSPGVLKASHHGSRTGFSSELAHKLKGIVIISAGPENQYNHPHKEVISLLEDNDLSYFRTDEDGTISVTCDNSRCELVR